MRWHEWGDTQAIAMRLARRERRQGPNGYVRLAARNVAQNKLLIESDGPKKWKYLWLEGRLRGLVFFSQPVVTTLESNVAPPSNVETIPSSRSPSSRLEPHFGCEKPTFVYRFMLRYWIHMLPSKVLSLPRHEPNTSKVELDPYMPWCCGPVNLWP